MGHVEQAAGRPHRHVLRDHSGPILHRQKKSGKRHHLSPVLYMSII